MRQLALSLEQETLEERRFQEFHAANPAVYTELVRLARGAMARGHRKLGVRMLWEVMRWNLMVQTTRDEDDFKLNNNHTSRYARMILRENADLAGIFDLRELRS